MAKFWSKDIVFLFAGYDVGQHTTRLLVNMAVDALDKTSFGEAVESALPGVRRDTIEWAGLFDDAAGALYAANTLLATGTLYLAVSVGTGSGSAALAGTAAYLSFKESGRLGELVRMEASWGLQGSLFADKVLTRNFTFDVGTTVSNSLDNGSAFTGGAHVILFLTAGSGTINIQDSADGTLFASWGTSIAFTGTPEARAVGTGTMRRWVQLNRSSGTGTLTAIVGSGTI